jgi:hypothetical protein
VWHEGLKINCLACQGESARLGVLPPASDKQIHQLLAREQALGLVLGKGHHRAPRRRMPWYWRLAMRRGWVHV